MNCWCHLEYTYLKFSPSSPLYPASSSFNLLLYLSHNTHTFHQLTSVFHPLLCLSLRSLPSSLPYLPYFISSFTLILNFLLCCLTLSFLPLSILLPFSTLFYLAFPLPIYPLLLYCILPPLPLPSYLTLSSSIISPSPHQHSLIHSPVAETSKLFISISPCPTEFLNFALKVCVEYATSFLCSFITLGVWGQCNHLDLLDIRLELQALRSSCRENNCLNDEEWLLKETSSDERDLH